MSSYQLTFYVVLLLAALMLSAMFAGIETGIYTLNRIRLDAHPGDAGESGGHGRDMLHLQHGQEGVRPARRGVRAARGTRPGVGGTRITRRGSRSRARRFQRHVDLDHDK